MDGVKGFKKKKNLISPNWNIISNHWRTTCSRYAGATAAALAAAAVHIHLRNTLHLHVSCCDPISPRSYVT